ncbi:MAG: hypothetical protein JKY37_01005 [Nannocystaceae bacterium]|nr:hypothetical protein [Nannocystaceae bacterium]
MSAAMLCALLDPSPDGPAWARPWVDDVLRQHVFLPPPEPAESEDGGNHGLRGWSVGAVVGNETLVQSRPIVRARDADPIDDLLRTATRCVIAAFARQRATGDVISPPAPKISRFSRWIGVRAEAGLDKQAREELLAKLPDFLARSQTDRTDGELVFLTFLAHLQRLGGLNATYDPPERINAALAALDEMLRDQPPHNVMVSDGRSFGMLHRGGTVLLFEPPEDLPRPQVRLTSPDAQSASLLLYSPHAPPPTPIPGAERLADGMFTIETRAPRKLVRG